MESAECRRVSDAEQLAVSFVKCEVVVKKEPQWDERGTGEVTPPQCVLYADHEIKDELMVFGPELVQKQDIASPVKNTTLVKEEKYPCKEEPPDAIKAEPECTYTCLKDKPCCSMSLEQRFKLRSCFVMLERIPLGDLHTKNTCTTTYGHINSQETPGHVPVTQQSQLRLSQLTEKQNSCNFCHKPFAKQSDLTRHIRIHTGEKPYKCDLCHKRFTDRSRLSRHILIHKGKEQHSCDVCEKLFVQRSDFKRHILTHMGDKPHRCHICDKKFTKHSDLTRHIRVHTREKPYSCDTCPKRFADKSSLYRHLRVHNNVKSHSCDICHKRFKQKSHLHRHILIHTGEKPFTCDICHKRFNQKATLICHIRLHTGEKPFACDKCHKRFVEKCHLTRHVRAHEGDKPFGFLVGMRQKACPEIDNDSPLLKIQKVGVI